MSNVVNLHKPKEDRTAFVRGVIHERGNHLGVDAETQHRWVGKALGMMQVGASAALAVSHCCREMTSEHTAGKPASRILCNSCGYVFDAVVVPGVPVSCPTCHPKDVDAVGDES